MNSNDAVLDAVSDWNDVNIALSGLVDLLDGCSNNDAPPADVLWRLLYMIEQYSKSAQQRLAISYSH